MARIHEKEDIGNPSFDSIPVADASIERRSIMSKLRYIGGFTGPGRHRAQDQHDDTWDHMRILLKRQNGGTPDAAPEARSLEQESSQAS